MSGSFLDHTESFVDGCLGNLYKPNGSHFDDDTAGACRWLAGIAGVSIEKGNMIKLTHLDSLSSFGDVECGKVPNGIGVLALYLIQHSHYSSISPRIKCDELYKNCQAQYVYLSIPANKYISLTGRLLSVTTCLFHLHGVRIRICYYFAHPCRLVRRATSVRGCRKSSIP